MLGWSNEIFLFLNIKRIQAALDNNKFDDLMASLFPTTIEKLKKDRKYKATVQERLSLIVEHLAEEFKVIVTENLYVTRFKFKEEDSTATSHYVLHFTKHKKGYELVKQIYYDFDNIGAILENDGCYTFDSKKMDVNPASVFDFGDQNILALSDILEKKYKGKTITAQDLFDEHHSSTQFCGTHYAQTLRYMVKEGKLEATFTDDVNHKVTVIINKNCILKFL